MLVFILFAAMLSVGDNIDKQVFDIGKKDLMLYEFGKFPEFIQPTGYLNYKNIYKNIYKKITKLNYTIENKLNSPIFGKPITIDFYRINHPIRYFELAMPFAN